MTYRNGSSAWGMVSAVGETENLDPAVAYALREWLIERLTNETKAHAGRADWLARSQVMAAGKHVRNPEINLELVH